MNKKLLICALALMGTSSMYPMLRVPTLASLRMRRGLPSRHFSACPGKDVHFSIQGQQYKAHLKNLQHLIAAQQALCKAKARKQKAEEKFNKASQDALQAGMAVFGVDDAAREMFVSQLGTLGTQSIGK